MTQIDEKALTKALIMNPVYTDPEKARAVILAYEAAKEKPADAIEDLTRRLAESERERAYWQNDSATAWDRCDALRECLLSAGYILHAEGLDTAFIEAALQAAKMDECENRGVNRRRAEARETELETALLDGNRPLPTDRDTLGRLVRETWVHWALTQPNPKPSWLLPYDELSEPDKEADRQIGEAIARWTLIHDAALSTAPAQEPKPKPLTLKDFGYAPGNYFIRCVDCCNTDTPFSELPSADKRAMRCEPCAQKRLDAALSPTPAQEDK